MDHALSLMTVDSEAAKYVEMCKWMQGLSIPRMKASDCVNAVEVLAVLQAAATNCSVGSVRASVEGRKLDDESQRQFRDSTGILLAMLASQR